MRNSHRHPIARAARANVQCHATDATATQLAQSLGTANRAGWRVEHRNPTVRSSQKGAWLTAFEDASLFIVQKRSGPRHVQRDRHPCIDFWFSVRFGDEVADNTRNRQAIHEVNVVVAGQFNHAGIRHGLREVPPRANLDGEISRAMNHERSGLHLRQNGPNINLHGLSHDQFNGRRTRRCTKHTRPPRFKGDIAAP